MDYWGNERKDEGKDERKEKKEGKGEGKKVKTEGRKAGASFEWRRVGIFGLNGGHSTAFGAKWL